MVTCLQRTQAAGGLGVGCRGFKTGDPQTVRHQGAGAPGGRQDGDAIAAEHTSGRQRHGDVQQVAEGLRPDHANLLEQRVIHPVCARQRTRVRDRRLRTRFRAANFERHHRLADTRRLECGRPKFLWIAHAFDIQRNHLGGRIIRQIVDKISQLQIDLVAGGNQLGQTNAARCSTREQGAQDAAALRHHADRADWEMRHFQRAAGRQNDVVGQVHQADGVGAEDAHAACGFDQLSLTARARFAGLGVAAGQHDGGSRSAFGQVAHGDVSPLSTEQDDGDVGHGR